MKKVSTAAAQQSRNFFVQQKLMIGGIGGITAALSELDRQSILANSDPKMLRVKLSRVTGPALALSKVTVAPTP